MKPKFTLATLCIAAALPLGALAAEPTTTGMPETRNTPVPAASGGTQEAAPLFEQLDANRDGFVTKAEAKRSAEVTSRFKDLDADGNGRISSEEFKKGMQPKY